MAWQQDGLELARHGEEGWRATFYPAGIAHSMTGSADTAWQTTPFDAVPGRGPAIAPASMYTAEFTNPVPHRLADARTVRSPGS